MLFFCVWVWHLLCPDTYPAIKQLFIFYLPLTSIYSVQQLKKKKSISPNLCNQTIIFILSSINEHLLCPTQQSNKKSLSAQCMPNLCNQTIIFILSSINEHLVCPTQQSNKKSIISVHAARQTFFSMKDPKEKKKKVKYGFIQLLQF